MAHLSSKEREELLRTWRAGRRTSAAGRREARKAISVMIVEQEKRRSRPPIPPPVPNRPTWRTMVGRSVGIPAINPAPPGEGGWGRLMRESW